MELMKLLEGALEFFIRSEKDREAYPLPSQNEFAFAVASLQKAIEIVKMKGGGHD